MIQERGEYARAMDTGSIATASPFFGDTEIITPTNKRIPATISDAIPTKMLLTRITLPFCQAGLASAIPLSLSSV